METKDIVMRKALGSWTPNQRLSNLAMAYYTDPTYAHQRVFPVCQVELPSGHFYEFNRADLARDNVKQKPPYGKVAPAIFGISEQSYSCKVYQVRIGTDEIMTLPYEREGAAIDPKKIKVRTITEQIALHQERDFAKNFFNASAWNNVWTGAAAADTATKKFKKFDNSDSDPITLFDALSTEIRRAGRRKPNKLVLGIETFNALKNNPNILEKIKYAGTTQNPAIVNENVLAQVFGVGAVIALDATYNDAGYGAAEDMKFACDSKGALLLYAPDTPSIDSPSAGYIFSWRLAGGNYIAVDEYEGERGTHTHITEGLLAYDMKKTSDALAIYLADCCG